MKKSGNTKSEKKLVYGAIITFLLAVAVFSSIKLTKVDAMNGKEYAKYKYYTSYQVQPGDTLTAIAQEHIKDSNVSTSDYIDEVMKTRIEHCVLLKEKNGLCLENPFFFT